jgi:hypothetical protein
MRAAGRSPPTAPPTYPAHRVSGPLDFANPSTCGKKEGGELSVTFLGGDLFLYYWGGRPTPKYQIPNTA